MNHPDPANDPIMEALLSGQLPTADPETRALREEITRLLSSNYSCMNGLIETRDIAPDRKSELGHAIKENTRTRKSILSKGNDEIQREIDLQRVLLQRLRCELDSTPEKRTS